MSDGERLVMYAPMAELRRNEELTPPYSSIRLTLLTPRSRRPRTSTGFAGLHLMCWRTHATKCRRGAMVRLNSERPT
ncbi:hypothetical protein BN406_04714 (plasmid) [Sinorhizobium meliloti Rm41]|nr:hypothetical protein BN406_04714 [Sinorhizobium meliloti Rm41]